MWLASSDPNTGKTGDVKNVMTWSWAETPTSNAFFVFIWEDLEDFISGKLTWQWKNGRVEDVFPIENGGFSIAMLVYWRVIGSTTYYFVNGS